MPTTNPNVNGPITNQPQVGWYEIDLGVGWRAAALLRGSMILGLLQLLLIMYNYRLPLLLCVPAQYIDCDGGLVHIIIIISVIINS